MKNISKIQQIRITAVILLAITTGFIILNYKRDESDDKTYAVLSAKSTESNTQIVENNKENLQNTDGKKISKTLTTEEGPSELEKDKIIVELEKLKFDNLSPEEILKNLEKIFTQEVTEELKSIEI